MNCAKRLLALLFCIGLFSTTLCSADEGDGSRFEEELNERDFDALRDYLKSKRALDIEENAASLTISGDVRTEYRHLNEQCNGKSVRGGGKRDGRGRPISRNDFDIEFNLRFDYVCDKTWAVAHVRYDNSAGVDDNGHPCGGNTPCDGDCEDGKCKQRAAHCIGDCGGYHGSGACDDLCLKKAYFGYEFYACGETRFFFELGRRGNLYSVFDSNIQFLSRFDGLLLKYESQWDSVADWYIQAAGFVVDEKVNHFAWVAEVGLLNIADSDVNLKYSIIDWEKHGKNRCGARDPIGFQFINSQVTASYYFKPAWLCGLKTKVYGAFLINHAADDLWTPIDGNCCGDCCRGNCTKKDEKGNKIVCDCPMKNHGKQNIGWYAGILFGEVRKEGDWALEIQYQYVQAQACPDDDAAGICRGNVLDESFTTCSYAGNTNYKGWKFEGLYAFTDNLTLDSIFEWSRAVDDDIGGSHKYSKFELEAIYAF